MSELTPDKKLLTYLNQFGIGSYQDISRILAEIYPPTRDSNGVATDEWMTVILEFLGDMRNHEFIKKSEAVPLLGMMYTIQPKGIEYLNQSKYNVDIPNPLNIQGDNNKVINYSQLSNISEAADNNNNTPNEKKKIITKSIILSVFGALGAFTIAIATYYIEKKIDISNSEQNHIVDSVRKDSIKPVLKDSASSATVDTSRKIQILKKPSAISSKSKSSDTTLINNGFINQGGTGNTYNQTINPAVDQRHLSQLQMIEFDKYISTKVLYFNIKVYNYDKESIVFGNEIAKYLTSKGSIQMVTPFSEVLGGVPDNKIGKVDWEVTPDTTQFTFTIYPLQ